MFVCQRAESRMFEQAAADFMGLWRLISEAGNRGARNSKEDKVEKLINQQAGSLTSN